MLKITLISNVKPFICSNYLLVHLDQTVIHVRSNHYLHLAMNVNQIQFACYGAYVANDSLEIVQHLYTGANHQGNFVPV